MICNFTHFSIALLWFLPCLFLCPDRAYGFVAGAISYALAKREQKPQDCREGSGAGEE